jgi:5-methyltetrahydropteroyltriglutamate--homocysteine methyltransferase
MPDPAALIHGQYPRSPDLVEATRDLDRGRTTEDHVEEVRRSDAKRLAAVQAEADLPVRSPALLRWQDLARPLVEATTNLEVGPLTRFFETNTFYRAPRATGSPWLEDPVGGPTIEDPATPTDAAATLPGPWTLARWTVGADDQAELASTYAEDVLAPQAEDLARRGFDLVVLHEPWLAVHGLARDDEDALAAAQDALAQAVDVPVHAHTYMGPATGEGLPEQGPASRGKTLGDALDALLSTDLAGVGVDFLETDLDDAAEADWTGTTLLAGVVDARNSIVEDPDTLAGFLDEAATRTGADAVTATHTASLEFLPTGIASEKVRVLGEVGA